MKNDTQNAKQLILLLETVSRLCHERKLIAPVEVIVNCQGKVWRVDCSSRDFHLLARLLMCASETPMEPRSTNQSRG